MRKHTIRTALILFFVALLVSVPRAQLPAAAGSQENRVALYQALLDLSNPWTVMCIAAHPDDEDGTSLIVMRRKYGAHTVSLFSTFGEGGQNAIGPELYEELGAIRARETMAAAEIQGSEPHFLGLKDFGYSKSADEAFRFWGHEEALRRMVLEIRKLHPDVIITNHSVTNNDHGHHQATARLELEAFDAAANPTRFPEQLKDGVTTWQVQRLFVRAGRSNQAQADTRPTVTIDPNEKDPVRGVVYAEEALRALQKHATQGPWPKTFADMLRFRNSQDGKLPLTRYVLTREAKDGAALPKDSHNFLDGLRLPEWVEAKVEAPTLDGHPLFEFIDDRGRILDVLLAARKKGYASLSWFLKYPNERHIERIAWRAQQALAAAAGIKIQFMASQVVLVPGTTSSFSIDIENRGERQVVIDRISIPAENPTQNLAPSPTLSPKATVHVSQIIQTPIRSKVNLPLASHLYDDDPFGAVVNGAVMLHIDGEAIYLQPARHFDVRSPIEVTNISPSPAVKTPADDKPKLRGTMDCLLRDFDYKVRVTNNQDAPFSGQLIVGAGFGRRAAYHPITIAGHDKAELTVSVPGCPLQTDPRTASVDRSEPASFTVVGNGATKPFARLEVPIIRADARIAPNLQVGYIRGFDYSLPNALNALGVESKELTVDEVKTADLEKYSAVIVDNRVYESQPELIAVNQKLLDYANAGGTLIVFYHKSNEWNPDERRKRPQLAPYKLILGDERITDENAPITFLEPEQSLLNFPNKMGQEDFVGWIQERGLYYPKDWDPQYHALLQSNDPGEAPLKGGLLVADYGRGHYIYTSMVWYRELRGGVPGAYRMLANMISYGRAEGNKAQFGVRRLVAAFASVYWRQAMKKRRQVAALQKGTSSWSFNC